METELALIGELFKCTVTAQQLEEQVEDLLDWDSFELLNLMTEVQERYGYTLTIDEIAEIETLSDLVQLLQRIGKGE
jgi:acyl carrier protein